MDFADDSCVRAGIEADASGATELLLLRATEGLSRNAKRKLDALLVAHPEWDDDSIELAAAAIELALCPQQAMPIQLRQRIENDAKSFTEQTVASVSNRRPHRPRTSKASWMAAAAILAAAFLGWSALTPSGDITLSERRTQLVASAQDVLSLEWTATEDSAATGASGDVAWSSAEQAGYMRFRGLKANDPTVTQYQLWVFDAKRDERYPVDGGVFDIPTDATEIVVPIAAKIFVSQPTLFAVTVEAPGGVVVSSRERIVLLAAL